MAHDERRAPRARAHADPLLDAVGLDTPGNYSSAADLVRLAAYDLAHCRSSRRIVALPARRADSGSHVRLVANRNTLVGGYPWIDGVKTGHTLAAGYVLVALGASRRDDA